jgi:hypothetical protein
MVKFVTMLLVQIWQYIQEVEMFKQEAVKDVDALLKKVCQEDLLEDLLEEVDVEYREDAMYREDALEEVLAEFPVVVKLFIFF